jgi:hypothetical protein
MVSAVTEKLNCETVSKSVEELLSAAAIQILCNRNLKILKICGH